MTRVLVVDDNAQNLALGQATLEDEGYEVTLAASGAEAMQKFAAERPDCILLDIRMPGMDGLEVCKRIRQSPEGADTPILFFTALRDIDTFDQALKAGCDDFLTKPIRPSELVVRVQSALKLRRMNTELREQYEIVRRQRDDLMRLQLQKDALASFVVHDLKAPISTMDLRAQSLLREPDLPPRIREPLLHLRADLRSLTRLVTNLLDISHSEEGRLTLHRSTIDLAALASDVLDSFEPRARSGNVSLARHVEPGVFEGDIDLLRRVLENVIDNALKHAPSGSEVRLAIASEAGGVDMQVTDAGRGVTDEMKSSIFGRFVQVGREELISRAGRGLGLAFCKLAVEAHGGRIWVEDADPGSTFRLRLPHVR